MSIKEKPIWLEGEREITAILHRLLDKLEQKSAAQRRRPASLKLNARDHPCLYRNDEASDRQWYFIQSLRDTVFTIKLNRRRGIYDPEYAGARLELVDDAEALLRRWLNRPAEEPYHEEWGRAVEARVTLFANQGSELVRRPLRVGGKTAAQVVEAFAGIARYADEGLTLRQLSARCFWGHSKLLDAREELLRALYPELRLSARPVIVHVYLPAVISGVLFIENQDTYLRAVQGMPESAQSLALVFSAGFRGSAQRIRDRDGASLHYHSLSDKAAQQGFQQWWFTECAAPGPLWFWGDLDFAGIGILKALRQRFADIGAWPPGYAPMLTLLGAGAGHSPSLSARTEQTDPGWTGCAYADADLLPAIRREQRFIDQEVV